jgi:putative acetyltransferase
MGELVIRSARDDDSENLIQLIGTIFAEYPGCVLDVDGEMPELRKPRSATAADSGRWWVAEVDGEIVGSVAIVPADKGALELKRLYVSAAARRRGLGARLVELVESEARVREATTLILWTDTRFEDAHRLYARLGFLRGDRTRALNDLSNTIEYHYVKELAL